MNMPETYESLNEHPPISNVQRMTLIPFVNSQVVLIRERDGRLRLPEWRAGLGRNYLHGAYLAPLKQAGVRLQHFHPFAILSKESKDDALFIVGWVDGQLRETGANRLILPPEVAESRLKEEGNPELADLVRLATILLKSDALFGAGVPSWLALYLLFTDDRSEASKFFPSNQKILPSHSLWCFTNHGVIEIEPSEPRPECRKWGPLEGSGEPKEALWSCLPHLLHTLFKTRIELM